MLFSPPNFIRSSARFEATVFFQRIMPLRKNLAFHSYSLHVLAAANGLLFENACGTEVGHGSDL